MGALEGGGARSFGGRGERLARIRGRLERLLPQGLQDKAMEASQDCLRSRRWEEASEDVGVSGIEESGDVTGAKRAVTNGVGHEGLGLEGLEESQSNRFNCCPEDANVAIGIDDLVRWVLGAVAIGAAVVVEIGGVVSASLGRDVVHRAGVKVWDVSRLSGQVVICLSNGDRTVGRRSAGGSLRGVGSWWSGEGFATLSV